MSNERYTQHDITYEGQAYRLVMYVDHSTKAPDIEYPDTHGVTRPMSHDFDPKDPCTYPNHADGIDEWQIRLSMFRPLGRDNFMNGTRWYDFLGTVIKATDVWGSADPAAAAEADYAYLRGWYNDEWHWATVSLVPLNDDGEEDPALAQYIGGIESTRSIEDIIRDYGPEMHADIVLNRARKEKREAYNAKLRMAIPDSLLT